MRKHTLTLVLSVALLAACTTAQSDSTTAAGTSTAAATATAADASSSPTAEADSNDSTGDATQASDSSADGGAVPIGTEQSIHTADFDARVAVTEVTDQDQEELGDPPYVVDVHVEMDRGDWTVLTSPIQFVYANGAVFDPIDVPGEDGSPEVLEGESNTWRFSYEASAGAGIGDGASVTIKSSQGKLLATWLT
ncbi:hypothetical protein KIH74_14845 [Kineosporia sp. J2-2]|uniref:DUF4352 domain-containing protein n=1 Tax=Kineosporia corallincola TaxID=2835133 RepID=A0ABS5TJ25_9ACTN|nr:hypothetical protein [Kineosporia corallincola]MBT0770216.1 hypothetical protein [Kineosporia corallincola]